MENASQSPEMKRFDEALRRVLRVSKEEMKERLAQEKANKVEKSRRGTHRDAKSLNKKELPNGAHP